jgi:hypothetical protein
MATRTRRIESQVQTVGEILRKPTSYAVQVYQRDFVWGSEQIDSFWTDITSIQGAIPEDQSVNDLVDRLGNLTLLEKGKNRGISNAGFMEKRDKAFSTSSLRLNRDLTGLKQWDRTAIEKRSHDLAKIAVNIWRLDY